VSGAANAPRPAPRGAGALTGISLLAVLWFSFMFFVVFPAGLLWWTGADLRPPAGASRGLGFAVIAFGAVLWSGPLRRFVTEGRGTPAPVAPPSRLVRTGLYTRIRNPMYASYVVIVLGEALLYRSLAVAVYAAVLFGVAHAYVVGSEEKVLRQRFGPEYDAYCARVGRWLPRRRAD